MPHYLNLSELSTEYISQEISVRARVHTCRPGGSMCFVVLRDGDFTIQAIANKKELNGSKVETNVTEVTGGDELNKVAEAIEAVEAIKIVDSSNENVNHFKNLTKVSLESVIIVEGILVPTAKPVTATFYQNMELKIKRWEMVSEAKPLPFQIDDVNDGGNSHRSDVLQNTRLNNRWMDLRVPVNNNIFKLQSRICEYFRQFLLSNNFQEIHSPKLIGTKTEGGSNVFSAKYFGTDAYLAQSPQLYKQMCINSDMPRVFEVGPVFRAENCTTHRHLCEYTGLDLEMEIKHGHDYHYVTNFLWNLLHFIVSSMHLNNAQEIEYIRSKRPFTDLIIPEDPVMIEYTVGVQMLKDAGFEQDPLQDLSTENERELGKLVKEQLGSDLFILDQFPLNERPFYTMPLEPGSLYSRSYDIIMRGEEISSGAQRVNDYNLLIERITSHGINPQSLSDYVESFSLGSKPHGGAGFGLERILMLTLDLKNVRNTSLFPRDPKRLFP